MNVRFLCAGAAAFLTLGAGDAPRLPTFTDITEKAGIRFKHSFGDHQLSNIVEGTGAGACSFDYDNDGLQDIYIVTGTWTQNVSDNMGRDLKGKLSNALYRNNGDGTFTDVTGKAGVGGGGIFSTGCSAADYDNDGDTDLYLLNYGPNVLYRNNGDGTFTDVSQTSGLDSPRWSVSAVWFDSNNDGYLDVYVGNYVLYDDGKFRDFYAAQGYPGPLSYGGQPDAFYRNNGNGTFTDVTKEVGMFKPDGRAMSVTAADFNNDGYIDVYVANDAMENYYFEATGKGTFVEKGAGKGLAFSEHGQGVSSMGPVAGDLNSDGLPDLFIPDLRYNTLLVQRPNGIFEDVTYKSGLAVMMGQYSGWGAVLFDYDGDGRPDIFTSHGHAHFEFVQEATLARNNGDATFSDVSARSGDYFHRKYVGRGVSYADFDNDGDVDLLVVNLNDLPRLLRNDGGNKSHWLSVEPGLKFPGGTRNAFGARVTVVTGPLRQIRDMIPVQGYLSQGDPRLHFGLGNAAKADLVEIRWPDRTVQKFENVNADQFFRPERETKAGSAAP